MSEKKFPDHIVDLFIQAEAEASVALDNDPGMRTHCLAPDERVEVGADGALRIVKVPPPDPISTILGAIAEDVAQTVTDPSKSREITPAEWAEEVGARKIALTLEAAKTLAEDAAEVRMTEAIKIFERLTEPDHACGVPGCAEPPVYRVMLYAFEIGNGSLIWEEDTTCSLICRMHACDNERFGSYPPAFTNRNKRVGISVYTPLLE